MISNVKGEFTRMTGTIAYHPDHLEASSVEAVIDANTINTRDEQRDAHLRSADFFDTAKYPTLTFRSKAFSGSSRRLRVRGDLTIRGVTREVVFAIDGPTPEVKDPWGNYRFGATATAKINRKDWGLLWNSVLETGGVMVGDEVTITLDLEAMRQAEDTTMVSQPVAS
jgi:polyisoprenoid-binding protein YceI